MASEGTQKVTKIQKYRRPLNINVGMVIFAVIFVYVCICISMYFKDNHIKPYEVREGSLASENLYTGIALREEKVVTANAAGYVNYYAREGERVAVGNLVYMVDETGRLSDYLSSAEPGENSLSDSNLAQLKSEVVNFVHGFTPENFSSAYDFKYAVKGTVLKLANHSLLKSLKDSGNGLTGAVNLSHAPYTGIVMYWLDGYENLTPDMVTADMLKQKDYEKNQLMGNEIVAEGDAVYKVCGNEQWSVVICVDESKAADLAEAEYVKVRFMKNQDESWAAVTILSGTDGNTYAQLSFNNSMVSFVNDRFLEVELLLHEETGLKIPNSAIAQREFFLIPENCITRSGDTDSYGIMKEIVTEDGNRGTEYVGVSVYSVVDGEYYVETEALKSGDHLVIEDTQETYTVSKRATLIGVFNMNKGYADFRQIEILYQNDEYAIVKPNTSYGLRVYDLIVQDASSVSADQFIYK